MNNIDAFKAHNKTVRIVGVAIVLVVAVAVGVVFAMNSVNRPRPVGTTLGTANTAAQGPNASPASSPVTQAPASSPAARPSAVPVAGLDSFVCTSSTFSSKSAPLASYIDGVRTGAHSGYDRLTIQFGNGQPNSISVRPQSGTSFTNSPKGDTVTLSGKNGLLVLIRGTDAHTSYSGALDFKAIGPSLREVRRLEDFEGQVQWGLGVANSGCYRAFLLSKPSRLVIDVQVA